MLGLEDGDVLGHRPLVEVGEPAALVGRRLVAPPARRGSSGRCAGLGSVMLLASPTLEDPAGWPRAPLRTPIRTLRRLPAGGDGHGATGVGGTVRRPDTFARPPRRHTRVATMDECLTALKGVLGDIAANPAAEGLDRSVSCRLTDLDEVVVGRLAGGAIRDLHVLPHGPEVPKADIRLTMASDDLVVADRRPSWRSGRPGRPAGSSSRRACATCCGCAS